MPHSIKQFNVRLAAGKLMRISSEDRQFGESNDDFSLNYNGSAFCQNVRAVVVKSISFKHNFPNLFKVEGSVPSQNTLYSMVWNGVQVSFEIPAGWYSATELATTLTNVANAQPGVAGFLCELQGAPVPTLQRKFVFSSGGVSFQLLSKDDGNTMADVLGIPFTTADNVATKIATYLPDLGGIKTIYVCSDKLSSSQMVASSNNGENIPVLSEVPVEVGFGEQILYQPYEAAVDAVVYANTKNLDAFNIRLCARNGSALPLNQYPLTIVLKFIYDYL